MIIETNNALLRERQRIVQLVEKERLLDTEEMPLTAQDIADGVNFDYNPEHAIFFYNQALDDTIHKPLW